MSRARSAAPEEAWEATEGAAASMALVLFLWATSRAAEAVTDAEAPAASDLHCVLLLATWSLGRAYSIHVTHACHLQVHAIHCIDANADPPMCMIGCQPATDRQNTEVKKNSNNL